LIHPRAFVRNASDRATVRGTTSARMPGSSADGTRQTRGAERLRVLWATDDSDAARVAEDWMLRLRWSSPPLVDVLCVATRRWLGAGLSLQTYRTAVRDAVSDVRQGELVTAMRTANEVGQRLQGAGLVVQVWARHGAPAQEIAALVRSEHPDLVVVSPRGGRGPLFPGPTVTERVIRGAEVAILVARGAAAEEGELPQQILLVVTDERRAEHALGWLHRAGWLRETRVILLGPAAPGNSSGGEASAHGASRDVGIVTESALGRLAATARAEAPLREVDTRLLSAGPLAERLREVLEESATDLVVMPHPHPGRRDVPTETIAATAPVSVLVLPVDGREAVGAFE
jgi:nucleotide-binding universal stress UspA family protein